MWLQWNRARLSKLFTFNIIQFVTYKMAILSKRKSHPDAVDYFKELPFYNKPIEKPKVKHLKNIDQLAEIPFYEQLSVIKTNQALRGYAMSYKVEIIERKVLVVQLETSKSSIKELISDLLNEIKVSDYCKVLLKKIQAQWRAWICSGLSQFSDKNSDKSQI